MWWSTAYELAVDEAAVCAVWVPELSAVGDLPVDGASSGLSTNEWVPVGAELVSVSVSE